MGGGPPEKRPAEGESSSPPQSKREAKGCSWTSSASACTWASPAAGGFAALGASSTGFGALSASAGGFGAVAAACGTGFGPGTTGFGSAAQVKSTLNPNAAEFVPKPLGAPVGEEAPEEGPGAADTDASGGEAEANEPSLLAGSGTGEEDEECAYRVRAKLFRLESREKEGGKEDETSGTVQSSSAAAKEVVDNEAESQASGGKVAEKVEPDAAAEPKIGANDEEKPSEEEKTSEAGTPSKGAAAAETDSAPTVAPAAADSDQPAAASPLDKLLGSSRPAPTAAREAVGAVLPTRWAERGVGQLRLLVPKDATGTSKPRLVMRVENVGRLILNEPLLPTTAPAVRASDTSVRLALVSHAHPSPMRARN
eukprot:scaffold679_cov32-Tisochrysis_lutea.AAC.3